MTNGPSAPLPGQSRDNSAQQAHRRGEHAERLAQAYIEQLGMTVLGCNVRVGKLEIDILARDGAVIVVIEVRSRGANAWEGALASIGPQKRQRLRRAGQILWSRRFAARSDVERMRFDVVAVDLDASPDPTVDYIKAAF